jgi:hypothetical protein
MVTFLLFRWLRRRRSTQARIKNARLRRERSRTLDRRRYRYLSQEQYSSRKGAVPPEHKGFNPSATLKRPMSLAGLGAEASTFEAFGAGFAPKGILRGRLAIPIHASAVGILRPDGESGEPAFALPAGFPNRKCDLQCAQVSEGELYLVRDPLDVLKALESGRERGRIPHRRHHRATARKPLQA